MGPRSSNSRSRERCEEGYVTRGIERGLRGDEEGQGRKREKREADRGEYEEVEVKPCELHPALVSKETWP